MKIHLAFAATVDIDLDNWEQDDIDDLLVYVQKVDPDVTTLDDIDPATLHDGVKKWLADDTYSSLFDVNSLDENDFTIDVLDADGKSLLTPVPATPAEGE